MAKRKSKHKPVKPKTYVVDRIVVCPYCHKNAKWVSNSKIYGKRYGESYMAWWCQPCDAYVGCHNNTQEPKGSLANAELRRLRSRCHEIFDPLWQSKKYSRSGAYSKISKFLGYEVHFGQTTLETINAVIEAIICCFELASVNQSPESGKLRW